MWQHSFVESGHEIFSAIILFRPLMQEGQLTVSGQKNVHIYWLTAERTKPLQEKCS